MAEIIHFRPTRPALRVITNDPVIEETFLFQHERLAAALDYVAAAQLDLTTDNQIAVRRAADSIADIISEETVVSLAHALIEVIDAKGNRNDDRPLRALLLQAIELREATHG